MTQLIDTEMARDQFEALDAETAALLVAAIEADFAEWGDKLLAARDDEALRRARHALKGLCGNFGATALEAAANAPLDTPAAREAFSACRAATVAAIVAAAQ